MCLLPCAALGDFGAAVSAIRSDMRSYKDLKQVWGRIGSARDQAGINLGSGFSSVIIRLNLNLDRHRFGTHVASIWRQFGVYSDVEEQWSKRSHGHGDCHA